MEERSSIDRNLNSVPIRLHTTQVHWQIPELSRCMLVSRIHCGRTIR